MKHLITFMASGLIAVAVASTALAEGATHKVAIHVDQNDPAVMNMALNNIQNVAKFYETKGDTVMVELVAYGPGLTMFVAGESPVSTRIETMAMELPNLTFSGCGNTLAEMEKKAGKEVPLPSEVGVVESGVVRLIELQEDGHAYVRP